MPAISPSWQAHSINWSPDPSEDWLTKWFLFAKIMIREEQFVLKKKKKKGSKHWSFTKD